MGECGSSGLHFERKVLYIPFNIYVDLYDWKLIQFASWWLLYLLFLDTVYTHLSYTVHDFCNDFSYLS